MKQITQQLKSGKMEIIEAPFPSLGDGEILIKNYYSVISAGTEGYMVTEARKGYIAKAKSRQKEVKQVIESIKTNGFISTYKTVMNKLEAPSPLGYSCAGEVIAFGKNVVGYDIGDLVACGGGNASHADVVAVSQNLCVKVPKEVDIQQAAFTTIAAIAMQGIRRADVEVGSNCVVIGLGLIGQITMQILKASGVTPIGVDVDKDKISLSKNGKIKKVFLRAKEGIEQEILNITNGYGTDAVIITAGTKSNDPVEFAGRITRKKGNVVVVGAVPTGFTREHYYNKELDLRISTSYGPGRYDAQYEEQGIDYPVGYVRFTENRNMQTFISLLESKKIDISYLITHSFELIDTPNAYKMILDNSEVFAGILVKYKSSDEQLVDIKYSDQHKVKPSEPNIGLIGAGNFAQNVLLPKMKGKCNFVSINTNHGNNSVFVARKYDFNNSYNEAQKVIKDTNTNTIFILTRHNTHAKYILETIDQKKHIFTEKPLALTEAELLNIKTKLESSNFDKLLMVGFNRRFSPYIKKLRSIFDKNDKKGINIRINSGLIPQEHWVNNREIGGGRIIGEACHFVDLAYYIAGAKINSVVANTLDNSDGLIDTVVINLKFNNGSIANISYFSNGNKMMPKENIEVFSNGVSVEINDFKKMTVFGKSTKKTKYKGQDKGHENEIIEFFDAIRKGKSCPIPFNESYHSTLATFKVLQSIKENRIINI